MNYSSEFQRPSTQELTFIGIARVPRGSIYTTIRELAPKYHTIEGIMGPNSLMDVYVDPLGYLGIISFSC